MFIQHKNHNMRQKLTQWRHCTD